MGKGPGTIYQDCLALAKHKGKTAAQMNDKITLEFNDRFQCYCLLEEDVSKAFLEENYSAKSTEKAIQQWMACSLVFRLPYKGYSVIGFYEEGGLR